MKNKLKEMRGITLIALVITIIVLLILAGVSIATLTGENGLLTQAQSSKTANKKAEAEEIFKLISNEWQIEKRKTDGRSLEKFLEDKKSEYAPKLTVSGTEAPYTLEYNGEEIQINNDGSLTEVPKPLEAGLYDENDNLKISWTDLTSMEYQTIDYYDENYEECHSPILILDENGVLSTGLDGENEWLSVSGTYLQGKLILSEDVKHIKDNAFRECYGLTSIVLSDSVTSIGDSAFFWCSKLTSINIPTSVTSIGDGAFRLCSKLTSINIPTSVTSIGSYAFKNCDGLTSIDIPNSVTSIGQAIFSECDNLIQITVDENNPIYDSRNDCNAIIETSSNTLIQGCKNTTILNSVTNIGDYAFENCDGLTSIDIPNSVTSIGSYAFKNCDGLTSIDIPNSVTSIGSYAFQNCHGLTSIDIPNSITSISDYVFENCTNLQSITIPNGVTSIGNYTFGHCTSLQSVTIPDNVTSIGENAFNYCTNLQSVTIPDNVTSIGEYAFCYCRNLQSINIPSNVTSISDNVFENCTNLQSITIPSKVTSIGSRAFYNCTNLESVYFEQTTAPTFNFICFKKSSGVVTTFYFKNSTVRAALTTSYYDSTYGTKSADYNW